MYVYCSIEACPCNHCCCGKAMSVTQPECVSVRNLYIQHAMRMRQIFMCPAQLYDIFYIF